MHTYFVYYNTARKDFKLKSECNRNKTKGERMHAYDLGKYNELHHMTSGFMYNFVHSFTASDVQLISGRGARLHGYKEEITE